jgi:hypothetical protein
MANACQQQTGYRILETTLALKKIVALRANLVPDHRE